jgi:hypothetical protein
MAPEDFRKWAASVEGGITGEAIRVGRELGKANADFLQILQEQAREDAKAASKAGDFDTAQALAFKHQFFREAYETATDTGSMKGEIAAQPAERRTGREFDEFFTQVSAGTLPLGSLISLSARCLI